MRRNTYFDAVLWLFCFFCNAQVPLFARWAFWNLKYDNAWCCLLPARRGLGSSVDKILSIRRQTFISSASGSPHCAAGCGLWQIIVEREAGISSGNVPCLRNNIRLQADRRTTNLVLQALRPIPPPSSPWRTFVGVHASTHLRVQQVVRRMKPIFGNRIWRFQRMKFPLSKLTR